MLAMRLARALDDGDRPFARAGVRGGQILAREADRPARGRSAGMPGRQRLRRGMHSAATVPRGAAELHLGGLGQRDRARRAAGHQQGAGGAGTGARRDSPGGRSADRAEPRRHSAGCARRRTRGALPGSWRSHSRHRCWCVSARRRWPTRSAPRAWREIEAGLSAHWRTPRISTG